MTDGVNAFQVTLGATTARDPAVIAATDATFGQAFTIISGGSAGYAWRWC
jgi:hypothetical protein